MTKPVNLHLPDVPQVTLSETDGRIKGHSLRQLEDALRTTRRNFQRVKTMVERAVTDGTIVDTDDFVKIIGDTMTGELKLPTIFARTGSTTKSAHVSNALHATVDPAVSVASRNFSLLEAVYNLSPSSAPAQSATALEFTVISTDEGVDWSGRNLWGMLVNAQHNDSVGDIAQILGASLSASLFNDVTAAIAQGLECFAEVWGFTVAAEISEAIGLDAYVAAITGNAVIAKAVQARFESESGGTIDDAYALYVDGANLAFVTNAYGLYIEDLSGVISGSYGVYQVGASDINYFRGNVGIGSGKTAPAVALDINGNARADDPIVDADLVTKGYADANFAGEPGVGFDILTDEDGLILDDGEAIWT